MTPDAAFAQPDFRPENQPAGVVEAPQVASHLLQDDGTFPNNGALPLLAYVGAVRLPDVNPAAAFEELFHANGWGDSWRNGVYSFHHYHSTAHEVLGVYSGTARIQLGGEGGVALSVAARRRGRHPRRRGPQEPGRQQRLSRGRRLSARPAPRYKHRPGRRAPARGSEHRRRRPCPRGTRCTGRAGR